MKRIIQTILIGALIAASLVSQAQDPKCKAQTKAGTACKNNAKENGFCAIHNPDVKRCGAKKKDGQPCRVIIEKTACRYHTAK